MSIDSMRIGHGTRCRTTRPTNTVDDGGSPVETFNTHLSSVTLKIDRQSGEESIRYRRETNRQQLKCFFQKGTDILEGDRIIPQEGDWEGKTLDVQDSSAIGGPTRPLGYQVVDAEVTV